MLAPDSPLGERVWFLRKFLRDPKQVASVWPSSHWLAAALVRDIVVPEGGAILEFGPGTGPVTRAIDDLLRGQRFAHYLGIERDPEFVALLRKRFPDFEFCNADVASLGKLLEGRHDIDPVAAVCGLPLVSMPVDVVDDLLRTVADLLPNGGVFRTFSYVHTMMNPASWSLRRRMRAIFRRFRVHGPVIRNMPPALVFEGAM